MNVQVSDGFICVVLFGLTQDADRFAIYDLTRNKHVTKWRRWSWQAWEELAWVAADGHTPRKHQSRPLG